MRSIHLSIIIALVTLCFGCGVSKKVFVQYQTEMNSTLFSVNQQISEIKRNQADMLKTLNNVKKNEEITKQNISYLTEQITSINDEISIVLQDIEELDGRISVIEKNINSGLTVQNSNTDDRVTGQVKSLTTEEWRKINNITRPIVIDFYATWCGPCKMMMPIYEQLSQEFKSKVEFYKVDVDSYDEIFYSMGGKEGIPYLVFIYDTEKHYFSSLGGLDYSSLKNQIEKLIDMWNKN